jgi:crossover junction endodeoxyribonuclease RusA
VQQIAAASAAVKHKGRVSMLAKLHPKTTTAGKASKIRMDLDNCIKVACDALQGLLYDNDKQIERISIEIGCPVTGGALSVEVLPIVVGVA